MITHTQKKKENKSKKGKGKKMYRVKYRGNYFLFHNVHTLLYSQVDQPIMRHKSKVNSLQNGVPGEF